MRIVSIFLMMMVCVCAGIRCGKKDSGGSQQKAFRFASLSVNGASNGFNYTNIGSTANIRVVFSDAVNESTISQAVTFKKMPDVDVPYSASLEDNGTALIIQPTSNLEGFSKYTININKNLQSASGSVLESPLTVSLSTAMDSTDKFPVISDEELLTLVQQQTFKYFWDFAHPASGLARERNTSGDVVTSGGSGFGIMAIYCN